MKKYSKTLQGFIEQQNSRGIGVTHELLEHLEDVKYRELPKWRKLFARSPGDIRDERARFIRAIPEYVKEIL